MTKLKKKKKRVLGTEQITITTVEIRTKPNFQSSEEMPQSFDAGRLFPIAFSKKKKKGKRKESTP